jgi:predicted CXXCH cytochrome family protein
VVGSKHDLSTASDPYSNQVCVFCHTPHTANTAAGPLWNRFVDQTKSFQIYGSAMLDTTPEQPANTNSMLCLGCHDGTLAYVVVGAWTGSDKHDLINAPGPGGIPDTSSWPNCERCHAEMYGKPAVQWTGVDLRDDHPINMVYPTAAQDPQFNLPPDLARGWQNAPLFNGRVQCASCHNPHDPTNGAFLRMSNVGSALCVTCHRK